MGLGSLMRFLFKKSRYAAKLQPYYGVGLILMGLVLTVYILRDGAQYQLYFTTIDIVPLIIIWLVIIMENLRIIHEHTTKHRH